MPELSKTILVADDNQNIRDILKANFQVQGYQILTAENGEEAIELIHKKKPDVIILDIMMPKKNGFQVCRQIKSEERYKDIPVIMLTARDQKEDKYWGKDCGADEYIIKPFVISELEKIVKKHIEKKSTPEMEEKISLEEQIEKKKREKKPFALCRFELDPKASTLFFQKYGEMRYSEMIEKVLQTIENQAKEEDPHMVLEQDYEYNFKLLIEGEKDRIQVVMKRMREKINDAIIELYDGDDFRKGYIVKRDIRTGQEEKVPLLSVKVDISFSQD